MKVQIDIQLRFDLDKKSLEQDGVSNYSPWELLLSSMQDHKNAVDIEGVVVLGMMKFKLTLERLVDGVIITVPVKHDICPWYGILPNPYFWERSESAIGQLNFPGIVSSRELIDKLIQDGYEDAKIRQSQNEGNELDNQYRLTLEPLNKT